MPFSDVCVCLRVLFINLLTLTITWQINPTRTTILNPFITIKGRATLACVY